MIPSRRFATCCVLTSPTNPYNRVDSVNSWGWSKVTTRRQHYVWRHYLAGWGNENDQVFCMRNGKIFTTSAKNIMVERDFYKLVPFTSEDVQLFQQYLNTIGNPTLREMAQHTFDIFHDTSRGFAILQNLDNVTDEVRSYAQRVTIEAEDNLHTTIESIAGPILDALRQENLDFLNDEEPSMTFFNFVAHQYFRTKRMRELIGKALSEIHPRHDFSRLRHVFGYCFADNLGGSLFVDRNRLKIVFLKNRSVGFVAGDQPIVNLAYKENMQHDDVVIYYPLSAELAVLLSLKTLQITSGEIPNEVAKGLNGTIAFNSSQFLVGGSEKLLQEFINRPSERPNVLDLMA